jgi:hypothetical protein
MTVVVDQDRRGGSVLGGDGSTAVTATRAARPRPVEFRRRLARRRRLVVSLRSLMAASGVVALSAALLAITLFSLLGR